MNCCDFCVDLSKDFKKSIEICDDGVCLKFTTDDPKKAEALKTMVKAYGELKGDGCCSNTSCC